MGIGAGGEFVFVPNTLTYRVLEMFTRSEACPTQHINHSLPIPRVRSNNEAVYVTSHPSTYSTWIFQFTIVVFFTLHFAGIKTKYC